MQDQTSAGSDLSFERVAVAFAGVKGLLATFVLGLWHFLFGGVNHQFVEFGIGAQ